MRLQQTFFAEDSGYIIAADGNNHSHAFLVYSKDEARRVLTEHASDDPYQHFAHFDLDRSALSETSARPTIELEGACVATLMHIAGWENLKAIQHLDDLEIIEQPIVCGVFTSTDRSTQDALMNYIDNTQTHHIVIFFSKEQGSNIVNEMHAWLTKPNRERIKKVIVESGLPDHTTHTPIELTGDIARYLNLSYLKQKILRGEMQVTNITVKPGSQTPS